MAAVADQGHRWLQPECLSINRVGGGGVGGGGGGGQKNTQGPVKEELLIRSEAETVEDRHARESKMQSKTHVAWLHTQICPQTCVHTHTHTFRTVFQQV